MKFGQKTLSSGIRQRPKTKKSSATVITFRGEKKALIWHFKMPLKNMRYAIINVK